MYMISIINPEQDTPSAKTSPESQKAAPSKKPQIADPLTYVNSLIKNIEVSIKLPLKFYHDYNEYAEKYNREVAMPNNLPLLPTYEELQKLINKPGEGTVLLSREKGQTLNDFEQSFVLHPLLQRFSAEFRKKLAKKALDSYAPLANKIIVEGLPAEIVKDNEELVELFERLMDIHAEDSEATKKMKKQTSVMMVHQLLPDFFPILTLLTWSVATRFAYQTNLMEAKAQKRRSKRSKSMEIADGAIPLLSEAGPLAEATELDEFFGCVKGIEGHSLELSYIDNKNYQFLKKEDMLFLSIGVKKQVGLEGVTTPLKRTSMLKRLFQPVIAMVTPVVEAGRAVAKKAKAVMKTASSAATRALSRVYLMERRTWINRGGNAFTRLVRRAVHGMIRGAANLFFKKRSMNVRFNREHIAVEIRSQGGGKIEIYEKEFAQNINAFTANMQKMREVKSFSEAIDALRDIEQQVCNSNFVKAEMKESLHFSLEFLEAISKENNPEALLEKFLGGAKLDDEIQVLIRELSSVAVAAHKDPSKLQGLVGALTGLLNPGQHSALQQVDNLENLLAEWQKFTTNMKALEQHAKELKAKTAVNQTVAQVKNKVEVQEQQTTNITPVQKVSEDDFLGSDADLKSAMWRKSIGTRGRGLNHVLNDRANIRHRTTIN